MAFQSDEALCLSRPLAVRRIQALPRMFGSSDAKKAYRRPRSRLESRPCAQSCGMGKIVQERQLILYRQADPA